MKNKLSLTTVTPEVLEGILNKKAPKDKNLSYDEWLKRKKELVVILRRFGQEYTYTTETGDFGVTCDWFGQRVLDVGFHTARMYRGPVLVAVMEWLEGLRTTWVVTITGGSLYEPIPFQILLSGDHDACIDYGAQGRAAYEDAAKGDGVTREWLERLDSLGVVREIP